jgi:hypothetical protein
MRRLVFPISFMLAGCSNDPACSSKVMQIARDIGSDRYVVTELRNCGATTDFATVVRLGQARGRADYLTEVFVADSNHGAATADNGGGVWTSVVWTTPGKLSVAYATDARVFKRLATARDVTVEYRRSEPATVPAVPILHEAGG